jgi:hypothetical protein
MSFLFDWRKKELSKNDFDLLAPEFSQAVQSFVDCESAHVFYTADEDEPDVPVSHWLTGIAQVSEGQTAVYDQSAQEAFLPLTDGDNRLLAVAVLEGVPDRAKHGDGWLDEQARHVSREISLIRQWAVDPMTGLLSGHCFLRRISGHLEECRTEEGKESLSGCLVLVEMYPRAKNAEQATLYNSRAGAYLDTLVGHLHGLSASQHFMGPAQIKPEFRSLSIHPQTMFKGSDGGSTIFLAQLHPAQTEPVLPTRTVQTDSLSAKRQGDHISLLFKIIQLAKQAERCRIPGIMTDGPLQICHGLAVPTQTRVSLAKITIDQSGVEIRLNRCNLLALQQNVKGLFISAGQAIHLAKLKKKTKTLAVNCQGLFKPAQSRLFAAGQQGKTKIKQGHEITTVNGKNFLKQGDSQMITIHLGIGHTEAV